MLRTAVQVQRAAYVRRIGEILAGRVDELSRAWVEQVGALAMAAPCVIGAGRFWLDYYAELAETYEFEERSIPFDGNGTALVVREPAGVAALIASWNNPFGIMAGKLAPALIAGCTSATLPPKETLGDP